MNPAVKLLCLILCFVVLVFAPIVAVAAPPLQLLPFELEKQEADIEKIVGPTPGLLLLPRGELSLSDEKYTQKYHANCYVYVGEVASTGNGQPTSYQRRFAVHAAGRDSLALVKRVARLLLLLYGENRSRLHYDHAYRQTVDVWLSNDKAASNLPDVGGEQFTNQIYIYNVFSERRPIEWAREVAHEYGHYALPGVSGFKAPEEWANGVLGERLFLKWIQDDLKAGRIKPEDLPIVKPEEVDEYVGKQVTPLIHRIAREGITPGQLARRDAAAMDTYTGLALYTDAVHGTAALMNAVSYTQAKDASNFVQAPDFLRGVEESLRTASEISYTAPLPARDGKADFWIYLPAGEFTVETAGTARAWVFASDPQTVHPLGKNRILMNQSAWRKLTLRFPDTADSPARLLLHRKGNELP